MTYLFLVSIHNSLVKAVADLGLFHCAIPCTDDVPAILTPLVKPQLLGWRQSLGLCLTLSKEKPSQILDVCDTCFGLVQQTDQFLDPSNNTLCWVLGRSKVSECSDAVVIST